MNKINKTRTGGFTLIELMIVIAIMGLLVAIAAPEYKKYSRRANFSEVILATTEFKSPAEVAVQLGVVTSKADLNAGQHGIPDKLDITSTNRKPVGKWVESVDLSQGVLTATSVMKDQSNAGYKFVLNADITDGVITWTFDRDKTVSTCISAGIC